MKGPQWLGGKWGRAEQRECRQRCIENGFLSVWDTAATKTPSVSHLAGGPFIKPIITEVNKQLLSCQHDQNYSGDILTQVLGQSWKTWEIPSGQRAGQECTGNSLCGDQETTLVWEYDLCPLFPPGGHESPSFPQCPACPCCLSAVKKSLAPFLLSPGNRVTPGCSVARELRCWFPCQPSAT